MKKQQKRNSLNVKSNFILKICQLRSTAKWQKQNTWFAIRNGTKCKDFNIVFFCWGKRKKIDRYAINKPHTFLTGHVGDDVILVFRQFFELSCAWKRMIVIIFHRTTLSAIKKLLSWFYNETFSLIKLFLLFKLNLLETVCASFFHSFLHI